MYWAVVIKIILGFFASFISVDGWRKLAYRWNGICQNDHSKYVAIPAGRKLYFEECYKRKEMFPFSTMLFKTLIVQTPANVDEYLTSLYGDYMTIPTEAEK